MNAMKEPMRTARNGAKKPRRVWIYVNDSDSGRIDALQKTYPYLTEAAAVSTLLHAGLSACERIGYTHLPTDFEVKAVAKSQDEKETPGTSYALNDKPPK